MKVETPPNNTLVIGHYAKLVRYKRYKPNSEQVKRGIEGRWQEWNGHGWTNCEEPDAWEEGESRDRKSQQRRLAVQQGKPTAIEQAAAEVAEALSPKAEGGPLWTDEMQANLAKSAARSALPDIERQSAIIRRFENPTAKMILAFNNARDGATGAEGIEAVLAAAMEGL